MSKYTIKMIKATEINRGLLRTEMMAAHEAIIVFPNGDWMGVTRYIDEEHWVADCAFRANGFPIFSNGTGSRVTVMRCLAPEDSVILNEAAKALPFSY